MVFYLDTSAAAKLVIAEPASQAMASWAPANETRVAASDLLRTELLRATRRAPPHLMQRARAVLAALRLPSLTFATFEGAATFDPQHVGSLDALHLAGALDLGDELDGSVTYDSPLAAAASACGITFVAPT